MHDDAIRAFLAELIDDAGLFPPAELSLPQALEAHARAAQSDAAWLARRFVVPASRAAELAAAVDAAGTRMAVTSVLDMTPPQAALPALAALGARIEALEVSLARLEGASDEERILAFDDAVRAAGFARPPIVYVECALGDDGGEGPLAAIRRLRARGMRVCAKVRCGGLEARAVPGPDTLAAFIWQANRLEVPFKATAGLHHPIRHESAALGIPIHGFLNVFGGAILARSRGLDRATLTRLIADRNAGAFELDERRFAWSGLSADASEIREARAHFAHSYGSCSFEEPVEDLRALGILPQVAAA